MIELSKTCRWVKGKGHDRAFAGKVARGEDVYLVAIADGLTNENGGEAAQWVISALERIAEEEPQGNLSARGVFKQLSMRLDAAAGQRSLPNSHTTLTCGVVSIVHSENSAIVRFDFFAVGDSPIWKIVPTKTEALTFQGFIVYAGPLPGAQGHVYSTVALRRGSVEGAVYFGSVDVGTGEVLVLASDGIPDSRVFWDDQDPKRNKLSPKLALRLLDPAPLLDETLATLITEYDANGLLIDDDASLVVVRMSSPLNEHHDLCSLTDGANTGLSTAIVSSDAPMEKNSTQLLPENNVATEPPLGSEICDAPQPGSEPDTEPLEFAPLTRSNANPRSDTAIDRSTDAASDSDFKTVPKAPQTVLILADIAESSAVPSGETGEQIEAPGRTDS